MPPAPSVGFELTDRLRRALSPELRWLLDVDGIARGWGQGAGTYRAVGKMTVLVIDDDPVILEFLRVNFEIQGFERHLRPRRRGGPVAGP